MEKIKSETLRKFFIQLAEHNFDDGAKYTDKSTVFCGAEKKKFPVYKMMKSKNWIYRNRKKCFHGWRNERREAIINLGEHLTPDITQIDYPSIKKEFRTMKYPDAKCDYFTDAYKKLAEPCTFTFSGQCQKRAFTEKSCGIIQKQTNIKDKRLIFHVK